MYIPKCLQLAETGAIWYKQSTLTYFVGVSFTVLLTSCFICLVSTALLKLN